jgi:hypothetical protein
LEKKEKVEEQEKKTGRKNRRKLNIGKEMG